jgi:outer membrane protein assembly factor BamD (BamD/ComL family)
LKQKEYKNAAAEYERVLTSYDRSPHIADTLKELAETEDQLKLTDRAARHRQLLTSLFPQSPALGPKTAAQTAAPDHPAASMSKPLDAPPTAGLPSSEEGKHP